MFVLFLNILFLHSGRHPGSRAALGRDTGSHGAMNARTHMPMKTLPGPDNIECFVLRGFELQVTGDYVCFRKVKANGLL